MDDKKDIEVVSGDGSNLDISPVYEHTTKPKTTEERPKNIVIPKESKKEKKESEDKDDKKEDE